MTLALLYFFSFLGPCPTYRSSKIDRTFIFYMALNEGVLHYPPPPSSTDIKINVFKYLYLGLSFLYFFFIQCSSPTLSLYQFISLSLSIYLNLSCSFLSLFLSISPFCNLTHQMYLTHLFHENRSEHIHIPMISYYNLFSKQGYYSPIGSEKLI